MEVDDGRIAGKRAAGPVGGRSASLNCSYNNRLRRGEGLGCRNGRSDNERSVEMVCALPVSGVETGEWDRNAVDNSSAVGMSGGERARFVAGFEPFNGIVDDIDGGASPAVMTIGVDCTVGGSVVSGGGDRVAATALIAVVG